MANKLMTPKGKCIHTARAGGGRSLRPARRKGQALL
jgi:hypothetical protein